MLYLVVDKDVVSDLAEIRKESQAVVERLVALIDELRGDPGLLDRMTEHGFSGDEDADFDVSKWHDQQKHGRELWRLKFWELEDKGMRYRLIYLIEEQIQRIAVLAVVPRKLLNYDDNQNELNTRIANACDRIQATT